MTRGADNLPVSDHAVLRYLQRVCGVDVDQVRRLIHAETETARAEGARGTTVNGIAYRLQQGYVTTCFTGAPLVVRVQHQMACKQILRKSKHVPILSQAHQADAGTAEE